MNAFDELLEKAEYKGKGTRTGSPGNYDYDYTDIPEYKLGVRGKGHKEVAAKVKAGIKQSEDICQVSPPVCAGNLGIERKDMPQIGGDVERKFIDHYEGKGVKTKKTTIAVGKLKATQKEINAEKAAGMAQSFREGKPDPRTGKKFDPRKGNILVSNDGHIVDGHHRFAAALMVDPNAQMEVTIIDVPIKQLLKDANSFPGVKQADFSAPSTKSMTGGANMDGLEAMGDFLEKAQLNEVLEKSGAYSGKGKRTGVPGDYNYDYNTPGGSRESGSATPPRLRVGQVLPDGWKVQKVTAKTLRVFLPSKNSLGSKVSKPLTFKWDGKGFKRQGSYLKTSEGKKYAEGERVTYQGASGTVKRTQGDLTMVEFDGSGTAAEGIITERLSPEGQFRIPGTQMSAAVTPSKTVSDSSRYKHFTIDIIGSNQLPTGAQIEVALEEGKVTSFNAVSTRGKPGDATVPSKAMSVIRNAFEKEYASIQSTRKSMSGLEQLDEVLEKAKYTKRTGTPGNYKYEYDAPKTDTPSSYKYRGQSKEGLSRYSTGEKEGPGEKIPPRPSKLGAADKMPNPTIITSPPAAGSAYRGDSYSVRIRDHEIANTINKDSAQRIMEAFTKVGKEGAGKPPKWHDTQIKNVNRDMKRLRQTFGGGASQRDEFKKLAAEGTAHFRHKAWKEDPTAKSLTEGIDAMTDYLEKANGEGYQPTGDSDYDRAVSTLTTVQSFHEVDMDKDSEGDEPEDSIKRQATMVALESGDKYHDYWSKSMNGLNAMDDYLEKGLPSGSTNTLKKPKSSAQGGSADGGELAGTGMTSGSTNGKSGPGQDASGQITGAPGGKSQKLSEDDAEVDGQMKPHKKPIETTRKSVHPADQRESVSHEAAAKASQLRKGQADVQISSDVEANNLLESQNDFYYGGSPTLNKSETMMDGAKLCKSGHSFHAMLSECPECGDGHVTHRVAPGLPHIGQFGVETPNQPLLRKAHVAADVHIGGDVQPVQISNQQGTIKAREG